MKPSGQRLIDYLEAVRAAAHRAYPLQTLMADAWHMGWFARRVGRPLDASGICSPDREGAWRAGWEAARGTWEEVGEDIMPTPEERAGG